MGVAEWDNTPWTINSLTVMLKMANYLDGSDGTRSECVGFLVISWSSVHQVEPFSQQESCKIPEHHLKYKINDIQSILQEAYRQYKKSAVLTNSAHSRKKGIWHTILKFLITGIQDLELHFWNI